MLDPRFGDIIRTDTEAAGVGDIVILGVPTDEGVRRNGGRVGAAQAPDEIRKYFRKLSPFIASQTIDRKIFDHGNITGNSLEEIHHNAANVSSDYISRGAFVISLGGGHDITYPLVSGVKKTHKNNFALINIDAHLDVREKKNALHHSGSSFRLLIEDEIVRAEDFIEFGIQSFAAAPSHIDWTLSQGTRIAYYDDIRSRGDVIRQFEEAIAGFDSFYLSFDIDSVRSSDAPGSSAPSPVGFTSEEAITICQVAASSGKLIAMDIAEVNPLFDIDGRTSRLAARMVAAVVLGKK